MIRLRFGLGVLSGLVMISFSTSAQTDKWIDRQYFDSGVRAWIVEITSTSPKQLSCTVVWDGIRTGYSDGMSHNDVGQTVHGKFTLILPPYPGRGAAETASERINQVGNFTHKTICA